MTAADVQNEPHTRWETAQGQTADDHAVVLWKPGCGYCDRLLFELGQDPAITWVNIYADDAARAKIRELNDGNELTPTVLVGERVLRNPSADELRTLLHS